MVLTGFDVFGCSNRMRFIFMPTIWPHFSLCVFQLFPSKRRSRCSAIQLWHPLHLTRVFSTDVIHSSFSRARFRSASELFFFLWTLDGRFECFSLSGRNSSSSVSYPGSFSTSGCFRFTLLWFTSTPISFTSSLMTSATSLSLLWSGKYDTEEASVGVARLLLERGADENGKSKQ